MWGDEDRDDESTDSDNDDSGRLYDFVVAKTNDQEENVVARSGFKVHHFLITLPRHLPRLFSRRKMDTPLLVNGQPPPRIHIDQKELSPRLLYGETMQGFMTAEFKQAKTLVNRFLHHDQSAAQIRLLL